MPIYNLGEIGTLEVLVPKMEARAQVLVDTLGKLKDLITEIHTDVGSEFPKLYDSHDKFDDIRTKTGSLCKGTLKINALLKILRDDVENHYTLIDPSTGDYTYNCLNYLIAQLGGEGGMGDGTRTGDPPADPHPPDLL